MAKKRGSGSLPTSLKFVDPALMQGADDWFRSKGIPIAALAPTSTVLKKHLADATEPVRDLLKKSGYHDYDAQGQGDTHKVTRDALWIGATTVKKVSVSLYRPQTTKGGRKPGGDPRIWFSGMADLANAGDLVVLFVIHGVLFAANWSDANVRSSVEVPESPIHKLLGRTDVRDISVVHAELDSSVSRLTGKSEAELMGQHEARLAKTGGVPPRIPGTSQAFDRDPSVVALRLARARGKCEAQGCEYVPFRKANNEVHLEVHHIVQLAPPHNGLDLIGNTAALCPNHHREVHLGVEGHRLTAQLMELRTRRP